MTDRSDRLTEFLQAELRRRGWSRRTLAMYAGVSPDTAARIVRGDGPFEIETLNKISQALGVDSDYVKDLAGVITERSTQLKDPDVYQFARDLESLPLRDRQDILRGFRIQLEATMQIINRRPPTNDEQTPDDFDVILGEVTEILDRADKAARLKLVFEVLQTYYPQAARAVYQQLAAGRADEAGGLLAGEPGETSREQEAPLPRDPDRRR